MQNWRTGSNRFSGDFVSVVVDVVGLPPYQIISISPISLCVSLTCTDPLPHLLHTQLLLPHCLEEDASRRKLSLGQVNAKLNELAREVPSDQTVERGKEWQNQERVHMQANVLR